MGFSGLQMLRLNHDGAITWGKRALDLAESLGDQRIVAGALNNIGSARAQHGDEGGWEDLRRGLAAALEADAHDEAARAHVNTMAVAVVCRDMRRAAIELDRCEEYCREQSVDTQLWYTTGFRARHELDAGRWDDAAATAHRVLAQPRVPGPTRVAPLVVLGLLRARRGDPDLWAPLDEARDIARRTGDLQRLAPVGIARAELHLLAGDVPGVDAETGELLALTIEAWMPWWVGELCVWRRRAGQELPEVDGVPPGYALELAGDLRAASAWWDERGCPYEAAQALAWSDDEDDLRAANDRLRALGARVPAAIVARRLRERGARDVRQGPRRRTRANPAGLTARQLDVLALVAEGRRNAAIAEELFLSEKTVAHHVSAILRKLEVKTRGEAAAAAVRLGILDASG
jgi:DNA-binding CsgD family transcriptional regulator